MSIFTINTYYPLNQQPIDNVDILQFQLGTVTEVRTETIIGQTVMREIIVIEVPSSNSPIGPLNGDPLIYELSGDYTLTDTGFNGLRAEAGGQIFNVKVKTVSGQLLSTLEIGGGVNLTLASSIEAGSTFSGPAIFGDIYGLDDFITGSFQSETLSGGEGLDRIRGMGGADILNGDNGDDGFRYNGLNEDDGDQVFGGQGTDSIGAAFQGADIRTIVQANRVDLSDIVLDSVENVVAGGGEVIITSAQLGFGGLTTFVSTSNFSDVVTILNANNLNLTGLNLENWEVDLDLIGLVGNDGVNDNLNGTEFADAFLGGTGQDTMNGGLGNDIFLFQADDTNPNDFINGDGGTSDTIEVRATVIEEALPFNGIAPVDFAGATISGVEQVHIVSGQAFFRTNQLNHTSSHPTLGSFTETQKIGKIVGDAGAQLLTVLATSFYLANGNHIYADFSSLTFENWGPEDRVAIIGNSDMRGLIGTSQNDYIQQNGANGTLIFGQGGNDEIYGSNGNDLIPIVAALDGGDGDDQVYGLGGNDSLTGGATGNDTLDGGTGNDIFLYVNGNDTLDGGADFDQARFTSNATGVSLNLNLTTAQAVSGGSVRLLNIENLVGGSGKDTFIGNAAENVMEGGGNDDVMDGGAGIDTYVGGLGNDAYYVRNLGANGRVEDNFFEAANQGIDGITTSVTLNLNEARYANIENVYMEGTASITVGGSAIANVIIGNSGNNGLYGLGSRDIMRGGGGVDTFFYLNAAETGNTATTRDLIQDFTAGTDKINLNAADANTVLAGNQNFTFLATQGAAFTGVAGQLRFRWEDNVNNALDKTIIEMDVNGDRVVDFQIELGAYLTQSGLKSLTAADFVL